MFFFVIVMRMESELIKSLVRNQRDPLQNCLEDSDFFDSSILSYKSQALELWHKTAQRYKDKESTFNVPFSLAEKPKLYAIDALVVAEPLLKEKKHLELIAQFWNVFFLTVHYFDDHVEHRDKFFSKFHFGADSDINTQRGAAPFSFIFISLEILQDILTELKVVEAEDRERVIRVVTAELIAQTQFFAVERKEHISFEEVFKIKQLGVSGETFGVFAELIKCLPLTKDVDIKKLKRGFMSLGSLIQITDDIRDVSVDRALNNANLVTAAYEVDREETPDRIASIYGIESTTLSLTLGEIYAKDEFNRIKALPFYPFLINKLELEAENPS